MQDSFARTRTRPSARDDRVSCIRAMLGYLAMHTKYGCIRHWSIYISSQSCNTHEVARQPTRWRAWHSARWRSHDKQPGEAHLTVSRHTHDSRRKYNRQLNDTRRQWCTKQTDYPCREKNRTISGDASNTSLMTRVVASTGHGVSYNQ